MVTTGSPSAYSFKPEFLKASSVVGEKTNLQVGLISYPLKESHISWTFASSNLTIKPRPIPNGVTTVLDGNVAKLVISNTTTDHFGNYTLTVNNNIGQPLDVTFEVNGIGK